MNKEGRIISAAKLLGLLLLATLLAAPALAGSVGYVSPKHVFSIDDVMCAPGTFGHACLSPELMLNEKDGLYYYGVDSVYGYRVRDFAEPVPLSMDGIYDNGMIVNLTDDTGAHTGVATVTQITPRYMNGALGGEWLAGLGGLSVKGATEHYLVMDHVLNAEWMPPLVAATFDPLTGEINNVADYNTRLKDDGKILFFWGNMNKEPTPLRLFTTMPLPEPWKAPGADYAVTSAKLVVAHRISTSPNDQIRPEDFENENATGILPQYTVDAEGRWFSAVDAYEGDGDFIPAGTLFRDLVPYTYDLDGDGIPEYVDYKTNAWYTTLDRDPFGGPNPRYRLKSSKFGQDIPGVEIPWYTAGQLTTTTLDLLSIKDDAGNSILARSSNWNDYLDINPEKGDLTDDEFTVDGCPLSPDFDLMLYIKGEYSGNEIFNAQLIVEYEDPNVVTPPTDQVDVAITSLNLPKVRIGGTGDVVVQVTNQLPGVATGTLSVVLSDTAGVVLDTFSTPFETTPFSTDKGYIFSWTAPSYKTTVTAIATLTANGTEVDPSDNTATSSVLVK